MVFVVCLTDLKKYIYSWKLPFSANRRGTAILSVIYTVWNKKTSIWNRILIRARVFVLLGVNAVQLFSLGTEHLEFEAQHLKERGISWRPWSLVDLFNYPPLLHRDYRNFCPLHCTPNSHRFKGTTKLLPEEGTVFSRVGLLYSLRLTNIQLQQADVYTVKATNVAGTADGKATLKVAGKVPEIFDWFREYRD